MFEHLTEDIVANRKPKMCTVGKWLDTLDPVDRDRLEVVLANDDLSAQEIADAIRSQINFTGQTLARHRRRAQGNGCSCP